MLQAAPGEWYISVVCTPCGKRSLVFRDLNKGTAKLLKTQIAMTCPSCGEFGTYPPEHYQEPLTQAASSNPDR